ncbi:glutathione S-transferase T3-like [Raphanus sativus]|uniref:Glutathione S-transferase T3-like n=1 Tax=Raphanus sativus TaxID=3726 RepID=A0A9W3D843_RAPSA|nr:glutathione S-transferase T3-like [Raphanus sativus]
MEPFPQNPQTSPVNQRRKWSTKEDVVLISAWLNTSKDAIVGTDQKAGAFWKRIVDYVCKFVGCYEAAVREQASGQNENDVMKAAHDIFFNDIGIKFTLEHCWRELRFDQKWKSLGVPKEGPKEKRKEAAEVVAEEEGAEVRPLGVKACKAAKCKRQGYDEIHAMLAVKKEIQQQKLLERLLAKDPTHLTASEITLMEKLISEMI